MGGGMGQGLASIEAIIMDVDGVLTDGKVLVDPDGRESVRFSIHDGYGIVLARREGLKFALLSGRDTPAVRARAAQLGIEELHLGVLDKEAVFDAILGALGTPADRVVYMGDDLNDLKVMARAGTVCAPANARPEVRAVADFVTDARGGDGAVRELIDEILKARNVHD